MKTINYTGSSKLISRIAYLLNRRAPLPLDGDGDPVWGTNGQFLTTDGAGGTTWSSGGGGGDTVSWTQTQASGTKIAEIGINGTSQNVYVPTAPTVNDGTLTIQQNGTTVGTFSANQSGDTTVNLTGGGSGGHTIENTSGTDLPQEDNLQFVGVYTRDDSVNSRTEVNIVRQMTKAAMEALSSAEKEGFIDTTDEDDDYIPISAEDVKYGNTDVESALDDIYSRISGGSRTVKTLVNESTTIATGSTKTYSALTLSALQAYDELTFMFASGNVLFNGSMTKAQLNMIAGISSGKMYIFGGQIVASGSVSLDYKCKVYANASGLSILNQSVSSSIDKVLIEGIKYN